MDRLPTKNSHRCDRDRGAIVVKLDVTSTVVLWTLFNPRPPNGRNEQNTLYNFVVPPVGLRLTTLNGSGLTAAPPWWAKIINASGKNFMTANAVRLGGLGVAIAPLQIWREKIL